MDTREDMATQVCRNIIWMAAQFRKESDKAFCSVGIGAPHYHILEQLHDCGAMPLSEISKRLWVTGGNVTGLVDRLVNVGCVRRVRLRKDRRVILAELTEKGAAAYEELRPVYSGLVLRLNSGLDDDEVQALRGLLGRLRQSLENVSGRANSEGGD